MFSVSCAREANAAAKGVSKLRKSKLLNLTFALALVTGLFAGSLASVGAISPVYGPEIQGSPMVWFPFVPKDTMYANGMGPFNGAVTIQNQGNLPVNVLLTDLSGGNTKTFKLNERASKTYSAAALGVPDGGGGVSAVAAWPSGSIATLLTLGMCVSTVTTVTRGVSADGQDSFANPYPRADSVSVDGTSFSDGGTYVRGQDYTVASDGTITIDWSPKAPKNEPAAGTTYLVTVFYCGEPNISGVEKHVAPVQNAGQPNVTGNAMNEVDGYTGVPYCDMAVAMDQVVGSCLFTSPGILPQGISLPELDLNHQARWILPIAQTNTGWDSIIHITNVSANDGVGVSALYYAANGQGVSGPSTQLVSTTLDAGQTISYDLTANGFPAGQIGSVWIDGDSGIVASVDRIKMATTMAMTNVAQPRNDNALNYFKIFGKNPTIKYAPLVFKDYNNWNTGINVANLSSNTNTVTVTFYNYLSNSTSSDTRQIPPRGMEYFYIPGTGTDINLGQTGVNSAIISGSDPLVAAVDEVKYVGNGNANSGAGHAMSYPAQYGAYAGFAYDTSQFPALADFFTNTIGLSEGRVFYNAQLNLPLVQKGWKDNNGGHGDTSGINLFNADPSKGVTAWVQFEDIAGLPVAPTTGANEAEEPIQVPIGALSSHTIYTMNYAEMPNNFQGSAVVGVVYPTVEDALSKFGVGPLVGVSNNVNYDVAGDGSSVFNMNIGYSALPAVPAGCLYPGFSNNQGSPLLCVPGIPIPPVGP
jgi:hypothetical protein